LERQSRKPRIPAQQNADLELMAGGVREEPNRLGGFFLAKGPPDFRGVIRGRSGDSKSDSIAKAGLANKAADQLLPVAL
jgi:hypothetical protein